MPDTSPKAPLTYQLHVEGMTCQHCVNRVEKALEPVDGISDVLVSLENNRVTITGGLPHQAVNALNAAGYPAAPYQPQPNTCDTSPNVTEDIVFSETNESYRITIGDMTCASCVGRVEKAILSVDNVKHASINLIEGLALVNGGDPVEVIHAVIDSGYPAEVLLEKNKTALRFSINNGKSDRETLTALLRENLDKNLQLTTQSDTIFSIQSTAHPAAILELLNKHQMNASCLQDENTDQESLAKESQQVIRSSWQRAILAGTVGLALMLFSMTGLLPTFDANNTARLIWSAIAILCLFTLYYSGKQYYSGAWKQAQHGASNMDTLVALGTAAAWIASVLLLIWPDLIPGKKHLYLETSVIILAFLQIGHALETLAKNKTRLAIRSLMDLSPDSATVVWNKKEYSLPLNNLQIDDRLHIRPGERIPIDSLITSGHSVVNESMLTGESIPVTKHAGDRVTGGTINGNGALYATVTQTPDNTTLAHIIERVKLAQSSKPPIGRLVDKVAAVFVPIVLIIAVITFCAWYFFGPDPRGGFALTTAIAVLVIACPCALGLATPIAIMIGSGRAAQSGILIRNGDALQAASEISHLVVDKTGTLTQGNPIVSHINAINTDENTLLKIASSLENHSEHPLASAILQSAEDHDISPALVTEFSSITGMGVQATLNNVHYRLGNTKIMEHLTIDASSLSDAPSGTQVYVADETQLLGVLTLQDPLRPDSKKAVEKLRDSGVKIILCTGDNEETAQSVANELGIKIVHSETLPADKATIVQDLQKQGHNVAMAGDGINDAPALAQAHVSFAIGTGSEVAIENADITLANNSLHSVTEAIQISKVTMKNIKQNLFGAFVYNIIGIPLAAGVFYPVTGWLLNPMFASAAMALSSVTVVTNANRLRFFKTGAENMSNTTTLSITGMTCPNCVKHALESLEKVEGVESVDVTLEPGQAVVVGSASGDRLINAVKAAGYGAIINE